MWLFLAHIAVHTSQWKPFSGLWCQHAWFAVQLPVHVCYYMPCLLAMLSQNNTPLSQCASISISHGLLYWFGVILSRLKHFRVSACKIWMHLHTEGSKNVKYRRLYIVITVHGIAWKVSFFCFMFSCTLSWPEDCTKVEQKHKIGCLPKILSTKSFILSSMFAT